MTHDVKVVLKYSGGSSYGVLALILGCPWRWYWSLRWRSWVCLGASVGGVGPLMWPLRVVLAGLGGPGATKVLERPGAALKRLPRWLRKGSKNPQEAPKRLQDSPKRQPRGPKILSMGLSRWHREDPNKPQEAPKRPQASPKRHPRGPMMSPRGAPETPRALQELSRSPSRAGPKAKK